MYFGRMFLSKTSGCQPVHWLYFTPIPPNEIHSTFYLVPHNLTSSCQMLPGTPNTTEAVLQGVELFIIDDMALHRIPGVCIDFLPLGLARGPHCLCSPPLAAPHPRNVNCF